MAQPPAHSASGHHPSHESHLVRPSLLPDRAVTPATIEDAYVRFIFYCNPALPRSADTQSLREAFRNPPRSGGKLFSPYVIFELVRNFYAKEIKTWTELTTRLGVEPPDPGKDESTQKIAQYGVRLKKWMNSMHIKAFFEYLMGIPNDYWTRIPDDPDPIALSVRDGIAVEDDMALRALLPHIRPKRGRKRPEEDGPTSPIQASQRHRPPAPDIDEPPTAWPTQAGTQSSSRIMDSVVPGTSANVFQMDDQIQSFAHQWPNPAVGSRPVNASSRDSIWDAGSESQPSGTPAKSKVSNLRRGAKNVSSAWKTTGWDPASSKTRGRPPINPRPGDEVPGAAHLSWTSTSDSHAIERSQMSEGHAIPGQTVTTRPIGSGPSYSPLMPPPPVPHQPLMESTSAAEAGSSAGPRAIPQVQDPPIEGLRQPPPHAALPPPGDSPRRSLPPYPPASGRRPSRVTEAPQASTTTASESDVATHPAESPPQDEPLLPGADIPPWYFETMENRTNVDTLLSYFIYILNDAEWTDPKGNKQEPAGLEESTAMVNVTLEQMFKTADGTQAFLINLAALAGARMLMSARPRCYREQIDEDEITYFFDWKYCFGHLNGQFTITNKVPTAMWKKRSKGETADAAAADSAEAPAGEVRLSAEQWQVKYRSLMLELEKRDRQILEMRDRVLGAL